MEKFEYKLVLLKTNKLLIEQLNTLGEIGWELIDLNGDRCILKRKKEKILCDVTYKIVNTKFQGFGSYAEQCKNLLDDGYELTDVIKNNNGDYYAHLCKYEYK